MYGLLGLRDFEKRITPTVVRALAGKGVHQVLLLRSLLTRSSAGSNGNNLFSLIRLHSVQISCDCDHKAIWATQGGLCLWVNGNWGQTGFGHLDNIRYPTRFESFEQNKMIQISLAKY